MSVRFGDLGLCVSGTEIWKLRASAMTWGSGGLVFTVVIVVARPKHEQLDLNHRSARRIGSSCLPGLHEAFGLGTAPCIQIFSQICTQSPLSSLTTTILGQNPVLGNY